MQPVPNPHDYVPDLLAFVQQLREDIVVGDITSHAGFKAAVDAFYTPAMMATIDDELGRWQHMASFANQMTLYHVTYVLVSLLGLEAYRNASQAQQYLMLWMVLFHDILKEPTPKTRDHVHAFRSAAWMGKMLPDLGFVVTEDYAFAIDGWYNMTDTAVCWSDVHGQEVQDNRKLPDIMRGVDMLFGVETPAAQVVTGVLLHMGITVVANWVQPNPISDDEALRYVSAELQPMLETFMIADSTAWTFWDAEMTTSQYAEIKAKFAQLAALR